MSTSNNSRNQIKITLGLVLLLIGLTSLVVLPSSSGSRPAPSTFTKENTSSKLTAQPVFPFANTAEDTTPNTAIKIEEAQRALQERYQLINKDSKLSWPEKSDGEIPGDFPEDGFYGEDRFESSKAVLLVKDLAEKLRSPGFIGNFVDSKDGNIDGLDHWININANDLPATSDIDASNYVEMFSQLTEKICKLKYIWLSAGQVGIDGPGYPIELYSDLGSGGLFPWKTCDDAKGASSRAWGKYDQLGHFKISMAEFTGTDPGCSGGHIYPVCFRAGLSSVSGKIYADLSRYANGTASIYLRTIPLLGGGSNDPPTEADSLFHVYKPAKSVPGGKPYLSEAALANRKPVFTANCPDPAVGTGWEIVDQVAIVTPKYEHNITDCKSKICVYVDCPTSAFNPNRTGHSFMQLMPNAGPQQGNPNLFYGFYSETGNIFWPQDGLLEDNGAIKNDRLRRWDIRICYNVSNAQYNAVANRIRRDMAATPNYNLIATGSVFNCAGWPKSVLAGAAITLPAMINGYGVNSPFTLCQSLNAIGNGGTFNGGRVETNPNPNPPRVELNGEDASPVPRDFSYEWIQQFAHTDPVSLASVMRLSSQGQNLGTFAVNSSDSFQVTLTNTSPSDALISIDWGDGSVFDAQSLAFSHRYSKAGTYSTSLAVVNSGSVLSYNMSVIVSDSATTSSVKVNIPTPVASTDPNPGFDDVILPGSLANMSQVEMISSVNPSDFGQTGTFTATVKSGAGTPTGSAQFKDNGAIMGSAVALNASGVATFATSALTTGTHTITAEYSGDAIFVSSTGTLAGGQVVRPPPSLSINDVSITEGDTGTKTLNFTVTLSAASNLAVNVNFVTVTGTATAASDYLATNGTLTFNPGDLTKTIGVTINGDQTFEPDEAFTVNLSNPVNATVSKAQGTGTIVNDDAQGGFISFTQPSYGVNESTGFVTITVNRANDTSRAATVDYATDDSGAPVSCGTVNNLASARCDFTTAIGTLKFAAGETQKTFTVLVNRDSYLEGPEIFTVNLSNLTGSAAFMTPSSATVEITDSPAGSPANLIDDASIFVRQHYHDLLNREPDAGGLAFWTNEITSCGSNAACIDSKRIKVSEAFFLSIEFQATGGTAFLANKAAFGTVPSYLRFERDSQALGRDYVFSAPGSAAVLEANKVAYFNDFVNSSEFFSIYGFLFNWQYVDALITNTQVTFTQAERDALVNGMNVGTETYATVLRKISEKQSFRQAESNRMSVLMEYFVYLRHDPDAGGFNFWLNKLNQFNGSFANAEMVRAFLLSAEYRNRFGP